MQRVPAAVAVGRVARAAPDGYTLGIEADANRVDLRLTLAAGWSNR
jgi:hypothetical protein